MDGMLSQDDLNCSDVDAELHGTMIQKLLAQSFHYPWIHGQRGARHGSIRRFGALSQLEVHHRVGVVGVETTIMSIVSMCIIVMLRHSPVPDYGHRLWLKEVMPARGGHDRPLELPRLIRTHSDKAHFCEDASACPELLGLVHSLVAELSCRDRCRDGRWSGCRSG